MRHRQGERRDLARVHQLYRRGEGELGAGSVTPQMVLTDDAAKELVGDAAADRHTAQDVPAGDMHPAQ